MKWSFTKDQVVTLNKKFKLHIFLVTAKFYNLNHYDHEIKTIDISNTAFADFKDFGVDNVSPSSNLKYLFVDLDKKGTYVNFYDIPKFQIEKAISHRKTLVKITQDEKIKLDMLLVTDKLANINLHYIPVSKNRINTINIEIRDLNGKLSLKISLHLLF